MGDAADQADREGRFSFFSISKSFRLVDPKAKRAKPARATNAKRKPEGFIVCPACGLVLQERVMRCIECGFDSRTGKQSGPVRKDVVHPASDADKLPDEDIATIFGDIEMPSEDDA